VARQPAPLGERRQVELLELLFEDLASLELNDGPLWYNDFRFWLVGVPTDTLFPHLNFEHAKVTQLDVASL
jgi:hypothetical protein